MNLSELGAMAADLGVHVEVTKHGFELRAGRTVAGRLVECCKLITYEEAGALMTNEIFRISMLDIREQLDASVLAARQVAHRQPGEDR